MRRPEPILVYNFDEVCRYVLGSNYRQVAYDFYGWVDFNGVYPINQGTLDDFINDRISRPLPPIATNGQYPEHIYAKNNAVKNLIVRIIEEFGDIYVEI